MIAFGGEAPTRFGSLGAVLVSVADEVGASILSGMWKQERWVLFDSYLKVVFVCNWARGRRLVWKQLHSSCLTAVFGFH